MPRPPTRTAPLPPELERYRRAMHRVEGWLTETDVRLLALASDAQQASGVVGDLVEIGAYHGKLAIVLGHLARPGERVVVCDLFGRQPIHDENRRQCSRYYADLTPTAFQENWRRFHGKRPVTIVEEDSTVWAGRGVDGARLVHIDGGHAYDVVVADLRTSRAMATEGAIVVLDDYRHDGLPGVGAAVWHAVATEGLVPLCASGAKLYAAWGPVPADVVTGFAERVRATFGTRVESHVIEANEVLVVASSVSWTPRALASRVLPRSVHAAVRTVVR